MDSKLQISVSQEAGRVPITVFHLKGDLDASSYKQLETQAREAHQNGARALLLDMHELRYMSSAGLQTLHVIFTMLRSAEASPESDQTMRQGLRDGSFHSPYFKLYKPTSAVQDVLKTAGFDMYIEIYSDFKEAVASF
jgi:anti-anti-sigma factor